MLKKGSILCSTLISLVLFEGEWRISNAFAALSNLESNCRSYPDSASTMISVFLNRDGYGDCDPSSDGFFDVESARRQLEAMVGAIGFPSSPPEMMKQMQKEHLRAPSSHASRSCEDQKTYEGVSKTTISGGASIASCPALFDVVEPPPLDIVLPQRPPLTSIERQRRITEVVLLENLREGDDNAIADLRSLWFAERGPLAESILKKADSLMTEGNVRDTIEAERLLRLLIDEYGVYFAEPVSRLAILCVSQERLEEALFLNKVVLAVKPWHFGALSQIVMVYESMGDSVRARAWARFRMPSIARAGNNKRRADWVERAIMDANCILEQRVISNTLEFGTLDLRGLDGPKEAFGKDDDGDAWQ